MKTQFNFKSAFCGLAVGILITLAIGAGTYSNEIGRYQISAGGSAALVIDTKTGKVWMTGWQNMSEIKNDVDFFGLKSSQTNQ